MLRCTASVSTLLVASHMPLFEKNKKVSGIELQEMLDI